MPTIFIGLLALALVLWLAKSFARVDPKYMIRVGRTAGGIVALAGAAFLGARGELAVALPLGVTGLGLLGWAPAGWWPGFWRHDQKSPGQASQVRSDFLIVELDHDTGAMTGEIIAGRLAGTKLAQLELSTLVPLLGEFDAESRDLLAAYLDRRHPRWREDAQGDAAAGSSPARSGKMTRTYTAKVKVGPSIPDHLGRAAGQARSQGHQGWSRSTRTVHALSKMNGGASAK